MARVLAISSMVACEAVGLSASRFALERLGHEVWAFPTVSLSNHPGRAHVAGEKIAPELLEGMLDAIEANGLLGQVDAVLTGYLPTPGHVAFAVDTILRVRHKNENAIMLCDPILGDDGKGLYIAEDAAGAMRDALLPLADIATPNRFELSWLTGLNVHDEEAAAKAAQALGPGGVVATSLLAGSDAELSNLLLAEGALYEVSIDKHDSAPHGIGDFLAAAFLARLLDGAAPTQAFGFAVAAAKTVLDSSPGADRLEIVSTQDAWAGAAFEAERVREKSI